MNIDVANLTPSKSAALTEVLETPRSEQWLWDQEYREALQLAAAREVFEGLVGRISQLSKLAALQGGDTIAALDDLAPLLFQHTVYKSYPISLVTSGRFDMLTRWLDGLTVHDLSGVDTSGCNTYDGWFDRLEAETPLRPNHSTGTTGKLSIIPRSLNEIEVATRHTITAVDTFGDEPNAMEVLVRASDGPVPIVHPSYRHGRHLAQRVMDSLVSAIGSEATTYVLNTEPLSADLMSLVGQVRGASQRGELDKLRIAPELLEKYRAMMAATSEQAQAQKVFFERLADELLGKPVYVLGVTPHLWDWMLRGEERGIAQLFAHESFVTTGGGAKGLTLPDDWKARMERFIGAPMRFNFGMSEAIGGASMCPRGNYHVPPSIIPFVLDLAGGKPLTRTGTQTGLYAFMDLAAETYWGGFVTGDKVTITWDGCACGRRGPYIHPDIQRLSEAEGGDDKVSCSGSVDAHKEATDWLVSQAGQAS